MKAEAVVILKVSYNPDREEHPSMWDWEELIGNDVEILHIADDANVNFVVEGK